MTIEIVLLIAVVGALILAAFFIGAKIGQTVAKGERIEAPNPIKAVSEIKEKKEAQKEKDRMDVIWDNIENYNGTSIGQRDVPKG